jgi:UDP-2,3-diacylglucosamine hydrolase
MTFDPKDVLSIKLKEHEKVYFASDFHLGATNPESSLKRELLIVDWLEYIKKDAKHLFLIGDIFDFWFEYGPVIPKGFERFKAKLLELKGLGIDIQFFTGNHDMWMFQYFPEEFGIPIHRKPIEIIINDKRILVGHGDGLGPGDHFYKFLKKVFANKLMQWGFKWIHPSIGIWLANTWSNFSRSKETPQDMEYKGQKEYLVAYSHSREREQPRDYYIFGHRHLPLWVNIGLNAIYINTGEWLKINSFTVIDSVGNAELLRFEGEGRVSVQKPKNKILEL